MHQDFYGPASDASAWVDELPDWAAFSPVGHVESYWRWRSGGRPSAADRVAAWGYRAGFGASGECGVLGGRFTPHDHPCLRVCVGVTVGVGASGPGRFRNARVGLPPECVGGVLAGALHAPEALGRGVLTFEHAAVHEVDSSWEVFRLLAIGVVRLRGSPPDAVRTDVLPRFGASPPPSPGTD